MFTVHRLQEKFDIRVKSHALLKPVYSLKCELLFQFLAQLLPMVCILKQKIQVSVMTLESKVKFLSQCLAEGVHIYRNDWSQRSMAHIFKSCLRLVTGTHLSVLDRDSYSKP